MKVSFTIIILTFLFACADNFAPDLRDSRLTRYTTEGLMTASAIINDSIWLKYEGRCFLCDEEEPPYYLKYYQKKDSLLFFINGNLEDYRNLTIMICLKNLNFVELEGLKNLRFDLSNPENYATIDPYSIHKIENLRGQLWFRHTTDETVKNSNCHILSGTFGFEYDKNGIPVTVHYGRFDIKSCGVEIMP